MEIGIGCRWQGFEPLVIHFIVFDFVLRPVRLLIGLSRTMVAND